MLGSFIFKDKVVKSVIHLIEFLNSKVGGDVMSTDYSDLWEAYLLFVGPLVCGILLGFLGIIREAGYDIASIEYILFCIGFLLVIPNIYLIKKGSVLQNVVSALVSGFLLLGVVYFFVGYHSGLVELFIGLILIVIDFLIFWLY